MIEVSGEGRACIPVGLYENKMTKAPSLSWWAPSINYVSCSPIFQPIKQQYKHSTVTMTSVDCNFTNRLLA